MPCFAWAYAGCSRRSLLEIPIWPLSKTGWSDQSECKEVTKKFTGKELQNKLKSYTGTTKYHNYLGGLKLTDGVKFMADACKAYWLVDVLANYQHDLNDVPFQVWQLYKDGTSAKVTASEDSHEPLLVEQDIEYTDFPLNYIELWIVDGVVLLPSEY